MAYPFQMRAMIPQKVDNLLVASKVLPPVILQQLLIECIRLNGQLGQELVLQLCFGESDRTISSGRSTSRAEPQLEDLKRRLEKMATRLHFPIPRFSTNHGQTGVSLKFTKRRSFLLLSLCQG